MAGTVTKVEITTGVMRKIVFTWLSDGAGAADATSTHAYQGRISAVHIIPGTAALQPDDLFDVTVTDGHGIDLLYGQGANCSNAAPTIIQGTGPVSNDQLILAVTNAGAANSGSIIVYVE